MRRVASVIGLPPEHVEEYERIHAAVWPAVLAQISASHITNYSIYRYGELLVSYFEYDGEDYEADMAEMAKDPETQRWWAVCSPLQRPVAERVEGEWWHELPEIFHTD
ncbi:L-rhamnose mutarotase [Demequina oxidasica]|uniref:L-rhamnose mutarotase n=1 Tax=Demequina oxidasica TaxID=676199 RepID=UPI000784A62A|nr:L-rhamnose mutarotase [Demequina oxidasica]